MGTQPASFSYSSIASTILVVMFAKHCGKNNTYLNRSPNDFQHSGKLRLTPVTVKSKLGFLSNTIGVKLLKDLSSKKTTFRTVNE